MADTGALRVVGLRELQRALRQADPKLKRLLGQTHRKVAELYVAAPARSIASTLGRGQAHLARGGVISGRGSSRGAAVQLTAGRYPDAFAQEFGRSSTAGWMRKPGQIADTFGQFRPWRGNQNEWTWEGGTGGAGYALHPAFRHNRQRILDEYLNTVGEAYREAFPQ